MATRLTYQIQKNGDSRCICADLLQNDNVLDLLYGTNIFNAQYHEQQKYCSWVSDR